MVDAVGHSASSEVDGEVRVQDLHGLHDTLSQHVAVGLVGSVHRLLVSVREEARSLVLVQTEASAEGHPLTGLNHLLEGEVVLGSEERLRVCGAGLTFEVLVEELETVFHGEGDVAAGLADLGHGHEAHVEALDGVKGCAVVWVHAEVSVVEHAGGGPLERPHVLGRDVGFVHNVQ